MLCAPSAFFALKHTNTPRFNAKAAKEPLNQVVSSDVQCVAEADGISENEATSRFFRSELFEKLTDEKLKLWHYSPQTLCELYRQERERGRITFPEEAG